jgi:hypothetical protein
MGNIGWPNPTTTRDGYPGQKTYIPSPPHSENFISHPKLIHTLTYCFASLYEI